MLPITSAPISLSFFLSLSLHLVSFPYPFSAFLLSCDSISFSLPLLSSCSPFQTIHYVSILEWFASLTPHFPSSSSQPFLPVFPHLTSSCSSSMPSQCVFASSDSHLPLPSFCSPLHSPSMHVGPQAILTSFLSHNHLLSCIPVYYVSIVE